MAYKPNIPQPTDKLSVSQADLIGNFQAIDDGATSPGVGFALDHQTLTAVSDAGKHKKVTLINQPIPTATGSDVILYNRLDANTARQEVFVAGPLNYPITGGVRLSTGWAQIGGGVYLIWRTQTSVNDMTNDTTLNLSHCPATGDILKIVTTPAPTSISGDENDYVVQVRSVTAGTVAVFKKSSATATRVANKDFTFLVLRI